MQNIIKNIQIFLFCFLAISSFNIQKAGAVGAAASVEFDLMDGVIPTPLGDSIFIAGDAFANYYNQNIINHNYGVQGRLGYKLAGAQVFGLYGVQHSGFSNDYEKEFKESSSPIYGFGVGYNLPIGLGLRLSQSYYGLEKNDRSTKHFSFTDLSLVFAF